MGQRNEIITENEEAGSTYTRKGEILAGRSTGKAVRKSNRATVHYQPTGRRYPVRPRRRWLDGLMSDSGMGYRAPPLQAMTMIFISFQNHKKRREIVTQTKT